MAYPTSATTYQLPLGQSIRVASKRRYVLVRQHGEGALPFVYRRSDVLANVQAHYQPSTDTLLDQAERTATFHFNGHKETQHV